MQLLARLLRMHVIEGVFSIMAAPSKPLCKYGSKCYRKNPEHLRRFSHPLTSDDDKCSSDESPGPAVRIRKRRVCLSDKWAQKLCFNLYTYFRMTR